MNNNDMIKISPLRKAYIMACYERKKEMEVQDENKNKLNKN